MSGSINRDVEDMERDMKGYPDLRQEDNHNNKEDFDYECDLEKAKTIYEFDLNLDVIRKRILKDKLEFNELVHEILDEYQQSIIDKFLLGEEL